MSNCSKKLVTLACAKQRIYSNSKKQQIVSLYLKNVSLERNITSFKKSINLTVVGKNTFFLVATKEVWSKQPFLIWLVSIWGQHCIDT